MKWRSTDLRKNRRLLFIATLLITLCGYFLYVTYVAAATRTWDGGGATNNWSECANWSSDACPGASDVALFDGTSTKNATVDGSFGGSVAGVDINSGYTGTITQARDLTIDSSNYNQAAGTWDQTTYDIFVDDGDFIQSSGTFYSGTTSSNTVEDSFTHSGGTFIAASTSVWIFGGVNNSGTFTYSGEFPAAFSLNKTNSGGLTIAAGTIVKHIGTITDARFLTINDGAAIYFANNAVNLDGIRISGTVTASSTFDIGNNNFILNSTGYFNFDGSQISTETDYTDNGGTFDETGITVLMDGVNNNGTFTFSGEFPGTVSVNKTNSGGVTVAAGTKITDWGTFTDAGFLTVQNGAQVNFGNTAISELTNLYVSGRMTASSTINVINGRPRFYSTGYFDYAGSDFTSEEGFEYYSGHTIGSTDWVLETDGTSNFDDGTITTTAQFPVPVAINNPGGGASMFISSGSDILLATSSSAGSVSISGTVDTQGNDFTASSISLNGSLTTLKVAGHETVTTPSIGEDATVEYTGSGTYNSLIVGTDYENLSFSGGGTYNISTDVNVEDDFTSTNDSTFNQTGGTFTLDGTGDQIITGTSTFNNFTKTVSAAATTTFGANQTATINGALTLQGTDGNLLSLASDNPGAQYKIDMAGFRTLEYLKITDGNNTNSETAYCETGCEDGGNNTNISFSADPDDGKLYWDNGGSDSNWSTCDNWKFNTCPDSTTVVAFDDRSTAASTLDTNFAGIVEGLDIEDGYTGTITSDRNLTIGTSGFSQADGTFTAPASILTIMGDFTHTAGTFTDNSGDVFVTGGQTITTNTTTFNDIEAGSDHPSSLLTYMPFDESASSTFYDATGNGNNGSGSGSSGTNNTPQPSTDAPTVNFVNPRSLSFDGTDDSVSLGTMDASTANFSGDITGAIWVKTTSDGAMLVQYQNSNPLIYMQIGNTTAGGTANKFVVYLRTNSGSVAVVSGSTSVNDGTWRHLAFTRDVSAEEIELFVDGNSEGTFSYTDTGAIDTNGGSHRIGSASYVLNGNVDDFRMYNVELTPAQIKSLANGERYEGITSGTAVTLSGDTLDVNNDLYIANTGTLDTSASGCSSASCDIEVAGDWNNAGTFNPRRGSVIFDGIGQSITGTTTFYDFDKSVTSPETITFGGGDTFTFNGNVALNGTAGNLLTATSTGSGVPWYIKANTYNATLEYLILGASTNPGSGPIYCFPGCTDGGGNVNWLFSERPAPRETYRLRGGTRLDGGLRF